MTGDRFGSGSELFEDDADDADDASPTVDMEKLQRVASANEQPPLTTVPHDALHDGPGARAQAFEVSKLSLAQMAKRNAPQRPVATSPTSSAIEGREVVLALAQVLCDPRDNVSRGSRPWLPSDTEVRELAHLIEHEGLLQPGEVRKLAEPVARETTILNAGHSDVRHTHYTHRVASGFKRFAALELLKRSHARFSEVLETDVDADRAMIRSLIENVQRSDPSEYNLAITFALLAKKHGHTPEKIAKIVGAKTHRVEQLLLIATRLPPELLDVFRLSPSPENRRVLSRIAAMPDLESVEATRQSMIDEWSRLQAGDLTAEEMQQERQRGGGAGGGGGWYARRINDVRSMQRQATGWFDPMTGQTREITQDAHEFAEALLRWMSSPKTQRNPLR